MFDGFRADFSLDRSWPRGRRSYERASLLTIEVIEEGDHLGII